MRKENQFLIIALSFVAGLLSAQSSGSPVVDSLARPDSVSGAKVVVHQDVRINALLNEKRVNQQNSSNSSTTTGYRVQVFSSNEQRNAKTDAFRIEKEIKDKFPDQMVYVNYTSPFWKVRVGDFRTLDEAQEFRNQIISVFPKLRSETYTVRDKITISGAK